MGFYAPAQIVRDAGLHGVEIRPVCINASAWDCRLEPADGRYFAVRLGLRMAKGLSETHATKLIARRGTAPYRNVEDVWRRAGVPVSALERLAYADAFHGFGLARRNALWTIRGLDDTELPLMVAAGPPPASALAHEPPVTLPPMPAGGEVVSDYRSVGLTLRQHPVSFVREELGRRGAIPCGSLSDVRPGRRITVAGIVLVRQRPGSAKGVMFATIEDETGHANIIIWPKVFERQRLIVLSASMIACRGLLQRESGVTHIVAEELTDLSRLLASIGQRELPFLITQGRGDQVTHGGGPDSREMPRRKPRDIYIPDSHIDALKVKTRDFR
jgi:error-prone DNA polymerase